MDVLSVHRHAFCGDLHMTSLWWGMKVMNYLSTSQSVLLFLGECFLLLISKTKLEKEKGRDMFYIATSTYSTLFHLVGRHVFFCFLSLIHLMSFVQFVRSVSVSSYLMLWELSITVRNFFFSFLAVFTIQS